MADLRFSVLFRCAKHPLGQLPRLDIMQNDTAKQIL